MNKNDIQSTREALLARIDQFLEDHPDISPNQFGAWSIGDSGLVDRLRKGGDVTTGKLDQILRYLMNPIKPSNSRSKRNG